ncbi:hypothetical protein AB0M02_44895 [Actinoplanes sp. NPDC051861]|uniref:hypothetical protein n=1 Tax=Actinoplanes sp. NPDC051861 TaxID=3155170 RepID=UPI003426825B
MSQLELTRPEDAGATPDRMTFEVDGWPVARLQPGESTSIQVAPGPHLLQIRLDWLSSAPMEINVPTNARIRATGTLTEDSLNVTGAYITPETALNLHVA